MELIRRVVFLVALLLAGCSLRTEPADDSSDAEATRQADVDVSRATPIQVWATIYYALEVDSVAGDQGILLRNLRGDVIGPALSQSDWCAGALEGTVRVDGQVFNFAGTAGEPQTDCPHDPSERVRWTRTDHPFGTGSRNNPLLPYRTVACDIGTVEKSRPWVDGGFPEFGQEIFIPDAEGTVLPDGTVHDGIFTCGDTGGLITGNHLDVFIGPVRGGESEARRQNPFSFVTSSPNRPVQAFVLR